MDAYEERFGWNRTTLGLMVGCVVLTAGSFLPDTPLYIRMLAVALFGVGGIVMAIGLSRGRSRCASMSRAYS
ncbi:hypothetical protein FNQ90_03480 [Streptomyces alkaliphilus]|uniref:Uncharacterized protein n=1 Tax=Streptomyces alkaliphilus TaxID=1472722 RepID=A0A7W3TAY2_9ACTN|nr:hypothetical protein [Streptomyces alkaliphilus]MBB0243195.1 hypothetical protein [Streptomyces alkaliphilus]